MSNKMDRRKLLKAGMLVAGGLPLTSGFLHKLAATPVNTCYNYEFISDQAAILGAPVELKARLFANENPFGPSQKAKQAIHDAMAQSYQYPFMFAKEFMDKIAETEGLKTENLIMGAGSSEILLAAAILFSQ